MLACFTFEGFDPVQNHAHSVQFYFCPSGYGSSRSMRSIPVERESQSVREYAIVREPVSARVSECERQAGLPHANIRMPLVEVF